MNAFWSHTLVTGVLVFLLTTFARAQASQFTFDPNGNLLVQTKEISGPPQIIGQPQNRVVAPGDSASFFVVAADTRALTYQWRFNGTNIPGAINDAVLLQNVSTNNEGEYRVVLTNPSGSVTSAPAFLALDSDGDGMGDSWELIYFGSLTRTATANFDGDGVSNLQEFLDDTNPTNSTSARYHLLVIRDGGSVVKTPDQASYTNGQTVMLTAASSSNDPFYAWLGDIVTRSNPVTFVMTSNKTVYARFTPSVITWTNLAGGDWNTAANWTPNLVPGSNDSVIINSAATFTVTLNSPADCFAVTLGSAASNPTLTGSGTLTVRGNFLWASGAMSGSGRTIIETGATFNLGNPNVLVLNGRTLENGGTAFWTGAGSISLNLGAVITNRAGAWFEVQSGATFGAPSGVSRFDNAGTFRKSGNTGILTIPGSMSLNNSGVVEIQAGTLNLSGGNTHSASSSLTGAGHLTFSGGTANVAGLVNVSGSNTFSGGTANLTGNYICTNNTLTISGGTANFSGPGPVSPSAVNLSSGTLDGASTVTVNTVMNWTGGTMSGSGRTIIPAGATLNAAIPSFATLTTRTLENGGTVLWTGAGVIGVTGGAIITNRSGALFHAQNAATIGGGIANGRFVNSGTFRKSASTGTTTFSSGMSVTNSGNVDIRSGILAATGGYTSTSNALLSCAVGGTIAGIGYGQLQVAGTVTLNGSLSVDLINGFVPATNDTFTVLTAGTRNATFASFFHPSNEVTMQLSNTVNSVIVRVTSVAPPRPVLLTPELVGSDLKVTWRASSNTTYRLEFNPDLKTTNWIVVPGDVISVSNTASKLDPLTSSNRVYRVRVLP